MDWIIMDYNRTPHLLFINHGPIIDVSSPRLSLVFGLIRTTTLRAFESLKSETGAQALSLGAEAQVVEYTCSCSSGNPCLHQRRVGT